MKNILFLTLSNFEDIKKNAIYPDLVRTLSNYCEVSVVAPREKRTGLETELSDHGNIKILKVKTGNITKCNNFIEKGISTLRIESQYMKAIRKYFSNIKFDLVLYSTPPITFTKIIKHSKQRQNSKSLLLLKDIFPQNAVDIGLIRNNGLIHKYFIRKEKSLYAISDRIGCTSENNISFVKMNNPQIDPNKVIICRNSIDPRPKEYFQKNGHGRRILNISDEATIFLYGGNLGKPQAIDFLLLFIEQFHRVNNSHLVIIGSGSEYSRIEKFIQENKSKNVVLKSALPKKDYNDIMMDCDVGLVFLDHRFTVPNNPARFTEYMEASLPMLAATDKATDTREWLENKRIGFWVESKPEFIDEMIEKAQILADDKNLRTEFGNNGRLFLEDKFTVQETARTIIDFIES
ncbi:MAG: glycosyltransferase family 4 protein [Bacteroidales bacterium]